MKNYILYIFILSYIFTYFYLFLEFNDALKKDKFNIIELESQNKFSVNLCFKTPVNQLQS
jgi:hypothetical protein